MDRIQKLPFILGSAMSLVIGTIGYFKKIDSKDIYLSMIMSLIIFL